MTFYFDLQGIPKKGGFTATITSSKSHSFLGHLVVRSFGQCVSRQQDHVGQPGDHYLQYGRLYSKDVSRFQVIVKNEQFQTFFLKCKAGSRQHIGIQQSSSIKVFNQQKMSFFHTSLILHFYLIDTNLLYQSFVEKRFRAYTSKISIFKLKILHHLSM